MGDLHGYLTLGGFAQCPTVPMFQAVYGGYATYIGQIFYQYDLDDPDRFAMKMAMMLLMGAQLGWFSLGGDYGLYNEIIQPQYLPQVRFVDKLASYRLMAPTYLMYGRMMKPIRGMEDHIRQQI